MLRLRRFTRKPDPAAYQREDGPLRDGEWVEHLDGTDWYYAEVPPRRHRCWPQSRARLNHELVERCACGAISFDGDGVWVNRNSRKPQTPEERAEILRRHEWNVAADRLIGAYGAAYKAEDWTRCKEICGELRQLNEAAP